jgi:hypothetical protein
MSNKNLTAVNKNGETETTVLQLVDGSAKISANALQNLQSKMAELAEAIEANGVENGVSLGFKFYNFTSIGETINCVFLEWVKSSKTNDTTGEIVIMDVPTFAIINKHGDMTKYGHLGKMVVDTLRDANVQCGDAFSIKLTQIENMKGGKTFKHYQISPLLLK